MPGSGVSGSTISVKDFDLRHTVESAQPLTFFSHMAGNRLVYQSKGGMVALESAGTPARVRLRVLDTGIGMKRAALEIRKRFRLYDRMDGIYAKIGTDRFMADAVERYRGMRLTVNDPWETTVCYIISQQNNVKRIRRIVLGLIDRYGDCLGEWNGTRINGFPTSEALMRVGEKELLSAGVGFRARYIMHAAEYCTNNLDLYGLAGKPYGKIKESLMEIRGVGDKVADCIALMGYGDLRAFPIDVWVKRTVERIYFKGEAQKIDHLHDFAERKWMGLQGYAQQYLFYHGRNTL